MNTSPHRRRRRSGFSLIELLVIIVIIGVLLAMLLPSMGSGKRKALQNQCLSNVRQWQLFWSLYANDNGGYFSDGVHYNDDKKRRYIGYARGQWVTVLEPYWSKKSTLLTCPMATEPKMVNGTKAYYGSTFKTYVQGDGSGRSLDSSYGINNWVYNPPWRFNGRDQTTLQGRPLAWHWRTFGRAKQPSRVPIMGDSMWRGGGPHYLKLNGRGQFVKTRNPAHYQPPPVNGGWGNAAWEIAHFTIPRHTGGVENSAAVNFSFMDGSARLVNLKELWRLKWHMNWKTSQRIGEGSTFFNWPDWMQDLPDFAPVF